MSANIKKVLDTRSKQRTLFDECKNGFLIKRSRTTRFPWNFYYADSKISVSREHYSKVLFFSTKKKIPRKQILFLFFLLQEIYIYIYKLEGNFFENEKNLSISILALKISRILFSNRIRESCRKNPVNILLVLEFLYHLLLLKILKILKSILYFVQTAHVSTAF